LKEDQGSVIKYECYRDLAQFLKENECPISIQDIFSKTEDATIRGLYNTKTHVSQYHQDLKLGRSLKSTLFFFALANSLESMQKYFHDHSVSLVAWPTVKIPACPLGNYIEYLLFFRFKF
jgi:hypothetical protein